jgi:hypothetical protein
MILIKLAVVAAILAAAATSPLWSPFQGSDHDGPGAVAEPSEMPGPGAADRPSPPDGGGDAFGPRSETIEQLEVGMARARVLAIAGAPERVDRMSTDFGYDVTLWYGEWEVWLSKGRVRTVNYYGA